MTRLLSIMSKLRDEDGGCEWDRAQDFSSIAPYTIEEAYEVVDAIQKNDAPALCEELGDLLLQVVFHAQMAKELEWFDFGDVVQTIANKMEVRHPHIFGSEDGVMGEKRWEAIKEKERLNKGETSAMDGVANALPALLRAEKIQKRAARTGFDWPDRNGPRLKLLEELQELEDASEQDRVEEAGDLLFSAVNLVRAYGLSSENALKMATAKFERRFRDMEEHAEEDFSTLEISVQEQLWLNAKMDEISTKSATE